MSKALTQITIDFFADEEKHAADTTLSGTENLHNNTTESDKPTEEQNGEMEVDLLPENTREELPQTEPAPLLRKSTRGRLSLKEIHLHADLIQIPPDEILFQKQYYSIGEVAGWFRVNQSLIRYWETEFDILKPRKNRKGDRFFRPVDVKNLVLIHDLLRRRKFTIEGAKEYLKNNKQAEEKFQMIESLEKIKAFLNELKASLG